MTIFPSLKLASSSSSPSSSYNNHSPEQASANHLPAPPSLGSIPLFGPGGAVATTIHHDSAGSSMEVTPQLETTPIAQNSSSSHIGGNLLQDDPAGPDHDHRPSISSASSRAPLTRDQLSAFAVRDLSASSAGKKPQAVSGNHLLNFHYDPIQRPHPRPRVPPPRRWHTRKPYNKDLFLQANFKFVLFGTGDAAPISLESDKMLQWKDIICVKYLTPFQVQCPICLDPPLCPQISSCGHIFCFPCLMQYLMMGEDDDRCEYNKKCPLCFMLVSSKDLYTIHIQNVKQQAVGDVIELILLTRKKDSFSLSVKNDDGPDINDGPKDLFSKFTYTLDVDMSVREAFSDLNSWLARANSGLVDDLEKLPYVGAAIRLLEQRKKYWSERRISNSFKANRSPYRSEISDIEPEVCDCALGSPSACDKFARSENPIASTSVNPAQVSDNAELLDGFDGISPSFVDKKDQYARANSQTCANEKDSYIFYQTADGQHLILHPLNMKCLVQHYGNYNQLPNRLGGKILQLESVTQSEGTRRRYRFLSHFSLSTSFQFCEIDLSEALPPSALSPFMHEIKNREKERKRLARKEHREKIKAESAGLHFNPISVDSQQAPYGDLPTFSMDDFEALGSSTIISMSPPLIGERRSFSSVTKLGFAAGHDSPALRTQETPLQMETSRDALGALGSRNDGTPSFSNVASRGIPPERAEVPKLNTVGKKGKKQNRVLLSTAGGRRY